MRRRRGWLSAIIKICCSLVEETTAMEKQEEIGRDCVTLHSSIIQARKNLTGQLRAAWPWTVFHILELILPAHRIYTLVPVSTNGVDLFHGLGNDPMRFNSGKTKSLCGSFSLSRTILRPPLAVNAFETVVNLLIPTTKRCPYLGCVLKWNAYEHTRDCPCHNSRFTENGRLIGNPAMQSLKY